MWYIRKEEGYSSEDNVQKPEKADTLREQR